MHRILWNTLAASAARLAVAGLAALLPGVPGGLAGQTLAEDPAGPTATAAPSLANAAFRPDTVLLLPGGPRLIRLSAPGSGLTALRLSIPVEEAAIEAGTARILQILGLERARAAARSLGVQVDGSRTPWGIAYTVVGPSEEFDYLAYLLREATAEPRPDPIDLVRARNRALEEARRVAETAAGRLAAELRAKAVPDAEPLVGSITTLEAVTEAGLRDLWRRTHRRESMSVILVGSEPVELVLAGLLEIGSRAPPDAPAPEGILREPSRSMPEVLRHWYGEVRVAGPVDDPHSAVVATLVSRRLREVSGGFESDVQLWDVGGERLLALTGTAYPAQSATMRRRIQEILTEATTGIGAEEVGSAVAALRFELLAAARTPGGLGAQVGRYYDATGEPDAAYRNLVALEGVTPGSLVEYVAELQLRPVARAQVAP